MHVGGRELHACTLQPHQQTVFVAIETTDGRPGHRAAVTYYGLLVLCFCKFVYIFLCAPIVLSVKLVNNAIWKVCMKSKTSFGMNSQVE